MRDLAQRGAGPEQRPDASMGGEPGSDGGSLHHHSRLERDVATTDAIISDGEADESGSAHLTCSGATMIRSWLNPSSPDRLPIAASITP